MRSIRCLRLVSLLLLCGCAKNPYQLRKEYQEKQAEGLRPAELDGETRAWRALRTLRVRLYLDVPAAKRGAVQRDFEERLERANQVLESSLRARLVLQDVRELPPQPAARSQDTDSLLLAIEQLDAGEGVEFVVAIISASPIVTLSFHELGRARVLGKHVVLRTMDDVGELQALENFDTLDPVDRSRLYQQRKRHKETAVLLHELGHCLAALHTRDSVELMHPMYGATMQGFAPENLELMGYVIDDRLTGHDSRRSPELIARLADHLKRSASQGWLEEERRSFLVELEQATVSGVIAQPQPTAASDRPSPQPAARDEDLSALSETARTRYRGLDEAVRRQPRAAYDTAVELARSYPDSLPVQQKACQFGMQLGVRNRDLKPLCDRMMELSMQPATH